ERARAQRHERRQALRERRRGRVRSRRHARAGGALRRQDRGRSGGRRLLRVGAPASGDRAMSVKILLVDDQALVRAGFRMILDAEPGVEVVGEAADGIEAVEAVRLYSPHVVLMDVRMPNLDGIEATRRILTLGGDTKVLMLTTFDLDEYVYEALRAGASGFLLKDVPPEQLVSAIHVVAQGEALLAPSVTRRVISEFVKGTGPKPEAQFPKLQELTPRELEVLTLISRGLSNAEIATELYVSGTTVKTHVARILMKLGLRDRVQAVVFAYEAGIVQPGGAAWGRPR